MVDYQTEPAVFMTEVWVGDGVPCCRQLLQDSPHGTVPRLSARPANYSLTTAVRANAVHPRSQPLDWRQQAFAMFDAHQNLPEWSNAPGPGEAYLRGVQSIVSLSFSNLNAKPGDLL